MNASGRGLLFVVSSPSGGGKTTLCRRLVKEFPNLQFSISHTTRARRGQEENGRDYHFLDDEQFDKMVAEEAFAEWAQVHSNRYGSSRKSIDEIIGRGQDLVFDIDYQGARQLQSAYPDDTVTVYVIPPSMAELERRLRGRGTDTDEVIVNRLTQAKNELRQYKTYDYFVLNNELDPAYEEFRTIYQATQFNRQRRAALVEALLNE